MVNTCLTVRPMMRLKRLQQIHPSALKLVLKFYDSGKWLENVQVKLVPRKDVEQVAVTVDFPKSLLINRNILVKMLLNLYD